MQPRRQDPAPQFVGVVFQRNDQHPGALEDMLAGQFAAGRERDRLQDAQRGFADAAGAEQ